MAHHQYSRTAGGTGKRLPPWFRAPFRGGRARADVRRLLRSLDLHTVCEGAACPNLCECWSRQTATFMLFGAVCTRNCRFCAVASGELQPLDPNEPGNVAEAAARLELSYVVLTCVTRDDLPDGGADHMAETVRALYQRLPNAGVEVLPSDFRGRAESVKAVLAAEPTVFNHNIETCRRLTPEIRSGADYDRSLTVLKMATDMASEDGPLAKSGLMLGLGETESDVHETLADLKRSGVQILTVGQYLPPSLEHWPLERYVTPQEFERWGDIARTTYGFGHVVSAPMVRSSYMAQDAVAAIRRRSVPR